MDPDGTQLECFGIRSRRPTPRKATLQVTPKASATPVGEHVGLRERLRLTERRPPAAYCLTDPTGNELACYPTKKARRPRPKGVTLEGHADTSFCVTDTARHRRVRRRASASPSPAAASASASASRLRLAVASPSPTSTAYSDAGHDRRVRRCRAGWPRSEAEAAARRDRGPARDDPVLRDQLRRSEPGLLHRRRERRRAAPARDRPGAAAVASSVRPPASSSAPSSQIDRSRRIPPYASIAGHVPARPRTARRRTVRARRCRTRRSCTSGSRTTRPPP